MQKRVTSEANLDTARAKRDTAQAAVKRIEAVIAQKAHRRRRSRGRARHPQGGEGPVRVAGHGAGVAAGARPDPRRLPDARAEHRQAARGPDDRADRRCFPRPGLQGRDPVARCARGAGHAHAAGARHACPIRSASCCPACSPTSTVLAGDAARSGHRAAHGRHLQPLRRQRLRGEAGAAEGGEARRQRRPSRAETASSPSAAS